MRTCVVVAACLVAAGLASPIAAAEPAHLLYRDRDGALRNARMTDVDAFLDGCIDAQPRGDAFGLAPPVTLTVGTRQQVLVAVSTDEGVWLTARSPQAAIVPEGHWCAVTDELLASLRTARTVPANRGPWLAFIAGFGGIGLAIALVGLWGRGVGPAPSLQGESSDQDSNDSTSASVT